MLILARSDYDLEDSWRQSPWYKSKWNFKEKLTYAIKHIRLGFKTLYNGDYDQFFMMNVEMPHPKGNESQTFHITRAAPCIQ